MISLFHLIYIKYKHHHERYQFFLTAHEPMTKTYRDVHVRDSDSNKGQISRVSFHLGREACVSRSPNLDALWDSLHLGVRSPRCEDGGLPSQQVPSSVSPPCSPHWLWSQDRQTPQEGPGACQEAEPSSVPIVTDSGCKADSRPAGPLTERALPAAGPC